MQSPSSSSLPSPSDGFFLSPTHHNNHNSSNNTIKFHKVVEIISLSLKYLPLADLVICCRVCKLWADVCRTLILPRKTVDFLDPQSHFRIRHNISLVGELMAQVLAVHFDSENEMFRVLSKNHDGVTLSIHHGGNEVEAKRRHQEQQKQQMNSDSNDNSHSTFIPPDPVRFPLIYFYNETKTVSRTTRRRRTAAATRATRTTTRSNNENGENRQRAQNDILDGLMGHFADDNENYQIDPQRGQRDDGAEEEEEEDVVVPGSQGLNTNVSSPNGSKHNFVFAQITDDIIILDHFGFWLQKVAPLPSSSSSSKFKRATSNNRPKHNKSQQNSESNSNNNNNEDDNDMMNYQKRFDYEDEDEVRSTRKFVETTSLAVSSFDLRKIISRSHMNALIGATHAVSASKIFVCHDGKLSILDITAAASSNKPNIDNTSYSSSVLKLSIKLDGDPGSIWTAGPAGRFLIAGFYALTGSRLQVFDIQQKEQERAVIEKAMNEQGHVEYDVDDNDEDEDADDESSADFDDDGESSSASDEKDDDYCFHRNLPASFTLDQFEFRNDEGVVMKRRSSQARHHHHGKGGVFSSTTTNHRQRDQKKKEEGPSKIFTYHFKCIANTLLNSHTRFRLAVGNRSTDLLSQNRNALSPCSSFLDHNNNPFLQPSSLSSSSPSANPVLLSRLSSVSSLDEFDEQTSLTSSLLNSPSSNRSTTPMENKMFFDYHHHHHYASMQQRQQHHHQSVFSSSAVWCAVTCDSKLIIWDLTKYMDRDDEQHQRRRRSRRNRRSQQTKIPSFASRKPVIRSLVSSSAEKKTNNNNNTKRRTSSTRGKSKVSNSQITSTSDENQIHVVDISIIEKSFCCAVVVQKIGMNSNQKNSNKSSSTTNSHQNNNRQPNSANNNNNNNNNSNNSSSSVDDDEDPFQLWLVALDGSILRSIPLSAPALCSPHPTKSLLVLAHHPAILSASSAVAARSSAGSFSPFSMMRNVHSRQHQQHLFVQSLVQAVESGGGDVFYFGAKKNNQRDIVSTATDGCGGGGSEDNRTNGRSINKRNNDDMTSNPWFVDEADDFDESSHQAILGVGLLSAISFVFTAGSLLWTIYALFFYTWIEPTKDSSSSSSAAASAISNFSFSFTSSPFW